MNITIEKLAGIVGVSAATVSRALRGLPNVAPSTRRKIVDKAAELNYSIDPHASRLASGRTMTVALVTPLADQSFYSKVTIAAEVTLSAHGYDLLRQSVVGIDEEVELFTQIVGSRRFDGAIVVAIGLHAEEIAVIAESRFPVVTIVSHHDCFSSVGCDEYDTALRATRHLINLGHERIGLISGLPDDPMKFPAPVERKAGFYRALKDQGLEVQADLEAPGNFSLAGGAEAMSRLLSAHRRPTAVFAFNDEMAIGAMKTVRDLGLRIPEDISIIGFDDHEMAEYVGLTTMRQPVEQYGETAAHLLLEQLSNQGETPARRVTLPTQLIVRSTTGRPAAP